LQQYLFTDNVFAGVRVGQPVSKPKWSNDPINSDGQNQVMAYIFFFSVKKHFDPLQNMETSINANFTFSPGNAQTKWMNQSFPFPHSNFCNKSTPAPFRVLFLCRVNMDQ